MADDATKQYDRAPHNGRHSAEDWLISLVQQSVTAILDERDRRYQERFEAQQIALSKVETATEKRFESVNEFRKAMNDRDVLYMPRLEYQAQSASLSEKMEGHAREDATMHDGLNKRIEGISRRQDTFEGTLAGSRMMLVTIAGVATFLVAAIVIGTFIFTGRPAAPASQPQFSPIPPGYMLVPATPPEPAKR